MRPTRRRIGIAELYSALLITVISLSMAYVVYSQMKSPKIEPSPVFLNSSELIDGKPSSLLLVKTNASRVVTLQSIQIDGNTPGGVLSFDGTSYYYTTQSLCGRGYTTFFSVFAPHAGLLQVVSDGQSWISGAWTTSAPVPAGWSEVVIVNAGSCSVTLPDGSTISSPGARVSPLPFSGALNSSSFRFFIPWTSYGHVMLFVFKEGVNKIAI